MTPEEQKDKLKEIFDGAASYGEAAIDSQMYDMTATMDVDLVGELWKPVEGYYGYYEISNMGRIRSLNYNHTKKVQVLKLIILNN